MTDLDIDAIENNFRTNPEVVAVCQLIREQREIIKARTEHIKWLDGHDRLMGDKQSLQTALYHLSEIERWSKGHIIRTPAGEHTAYSVIHLQIDAATILIRERIEAEPS